MGTEIMLNSIQATKLKEIFADGNVTAEELAKAKENNISEELITQLQGKSEDERNDYFNKLINIAEPEENNDSPNVLKKTIVSTASCGILGGAISSMLKYMGAFKNSKLTSIIGIGAIIGGVMGGIGALVERCSGKKEGKEVKEVKEEPTENYNPRTETIPATTMTITENDEHNPITLCNDLGISFSILKLCNPDLNLDLPLENGTELNIPERIVVKPGTVTNIEETAEAAGVSPEYIKDILFSIEGKNGIAALKPYDDLNETIDENGYPVRIREGKNGTLTIGYGHTGRVFGKIMTRANRNNIEITKDQAYELLAADIISARADAVKYYGTAFTDAPQSIQDAIVDIVFNKGLEKGLGLQKFADCKLQTLTPQIKRCLEEKDYAGCVSKLIYETGMKGLHKRNFYRLITAMRDLTPEERQQAMNDIEPYYNKVRTLFRGKRSELDYINKAWENATNGICSGFMN